MKRATAVAQLAAVADGVLTTAAEAKTPRIVDLAAQLLHAQGTDAQETRYRTLYERSGTGRNRRSDLAR